MTRKNFTPAIKAYLLEVISTEDHEIENPTEKELFTYVKERFNSEYGFMIDRVGQQNACKEWLQGLALNVEYTYYEIEKLLRKWGVLHSNSTDSQVEKELDKYWDRLACNIVKNINKI